MHPEHHESTTAAASPTAGDALRELLAPFTNEAAATRAAIEDRSRSQRKINAWLIAFVAVLLALTGSVLYVLVQDGQRRAQSREIIRNNAVLNQQIADCTRPAGSCYQQNQKRLQQTIQKLIESNVAIAECARQDGTEADLRTCVEKRLDEATQAG